MTDRRSSLATDMLGGAASPQKADPAQVLCVQIAEDDDTACRRCERPIRRGQRIVLLLGTGNVHLRCLVQHQADHGETNTRYYVGISLRSAHNGEDRVSARVNVTGDPLTQDDTRENPLWAERSSGLCTVCTKCGEPLDQALINAGLTDHGEAK